MVQFSSNGSQLQYMKRDQFLVSPRMNPKRGP